MIRTQIQLPEPLLARLKRIAAQRDVSVAELVRRGMERYVETCPETDSARKPWQFPVLPPSGGLRTDPALIRPEADAIEARMKEADHVDG